MQAHSVDSCFFIKAHQITDLPLTPPKQKIGLQVDISNTQYITR